MYFHITAFVLSVVQWHKASNLWVRAIEPRIDLFPWRHFRKSQQLPGRVVIRKSMVSTSHDGHRGKIHARKVQRSIAFLWQVEDIMYSFKLSLVLRQKKYNIFFWLIDNCELPLRSDTKVVSSLSAICDTIPNIISSNPNSSMISFRRMGKKIMQQYTILYI